MQKISTEFEHLDFSFALINKTSHFYEWTEGLNRSNGVACREFKADDIWQY